MGGAGDDLLHQPEGVELLYPAVAVDVFQVQLLVRDKDEVLGFEGGVLVTCVRRQLKVQEPKRLGGLHRRERNAVLGLGCRVQVAQRLRTAFLQEKRLEDVEVLIDRAEAERHGVEGVHRIALEHFVEIPREDFLVHLVEVDHGERHGEARAHPPCNPGWVGLGFVISPENVGVGVV